MQEHSCPWSASCFRCGAFRPLLFATWEEPKICYFCERELKKTATNPLIKNAGSPLTPPIAAPEIAESFASLNIKKQN